MEVKSSEIKYKTGDDEITAYLSFPADGKKYPGIVHIHDIFGLSDHVRKVSDNLAKEGYVVLAPHLFSSRKLSPTLTPEAIGDAMKFMMSIPMDKQRDESYRQAELQKMDEKKRNAIMGVYTTLFMKRPTDLFTQYLSDAVNYLNSLENVNGKIGSVGFCFGGGMSINLACTGKTDASIIFYGENPDPIDKIKNVKGAVMGLYGGEDQRINSKIDELVKAMVDNKKAFSIKVYPGAYHAFFNDTMPHYNKEAAEDAWKMTTSFFSQNLK
jgi:carboxymethylenebutenolidase